MIIITNKAQINTETDPVVLVFNSDDEMNNVLTKIASTSVLTSGFRVVSLVEEQNLTPLQNLILEVITGLDGVGGNDHNKILDSCIESINNILKNNK